MSSSSRKKLRQHRRRLAEKAPLESRVFADAADITRAFEDFLTLEAAGWKGGRGTALLCSQRDVAFGRAMIASLAARGNASIHALYQNGKPVASQIVLRAGATAFTWKTAYDESLGDFSPGMLLLEDYTAAFLADKSIVRVDSCAFDDSGFMSAWREREQIAHVLLEARPGGSLSLHFIAALQRGALALRAIAKKVYLLGRRHWTGH
jgi:CelD/BcsL family acetyltransferase involved in cellulose biosynthesis